MKKILRNLSLLCLVASAGCQSESMELVAEPGYGLVQLACRADAEVVTRAADFTVPEAGEFSLAINGTAYSASWEQFSQFVSADNKLLAGDYTASVEWGDLTQEGVNKPYYAGSTDFTILSQQVTQATITAKVANSLVKVVCSEQFQDYFHGESFTLTTAAGNEFAFDADSTDPVFITPGSFTLSGSALMQTENTVEFPTQSRTAAAGVLYTFTYHISTAGSATVTISLDDQVIEELEITTELNPES